MSRKHPGAKRVVRTLSFHEWIDGEAGLKFATREQVVAFANMQLQEQVVPLLRNAIARYDAERRARSPGRRLLRWLRRVLGRPMTHDEMVEELVLAEQRGQPGPAVPDVAGTEPADAAVVGGIGVPDDNGEPRRTCVTCGSVQLEPVNERGGLKCPNGHIIENPPEQGGAP